MNNVIVVHVDTDCSVKDQVNNVKETMENSEPGPSTAPPPQLLNNGSKSIIEADSSGIMEANDIRYPPPPEDLKAIREAILEQDDQRRSSSMSSEGGLCYRQCTAYRLDGFLKNPTDLAIGFQLVAVADYDNGVHFVDFKGNVRKHFVSPPYRICGVRLKPDTDHIIMLAYLEQNWTIMIKKWPDLSDVSAVECPSEPAITPWARRKITLLGNFLYLLGTCDSCSAIWMLDLNTLNWKTLVVEKAALKKPGGVGASFTSSFRGFSHNEEKHAIYSDFDTKQWTEEERRILLCDLEKSRLNILRFNENDKLANNHVIKVKRKKDQRWIVKGPQLAVYDEEQDIIVYDCSGKIFWFDGTDYRMRKIIGDVGKSEVCALAVDSGWCYALCRHRLCVHAFMYRT